jgi:hypothetical protein
MRRLAISAATAYSWPAACCSRPPVVAAAVALHPDLHRRSRRPGSPSCRRRTGSRTGGPDLQPALLPTHPDQRAKCVTPEGHLAHPSALGHRGEVLRRGPAARLQERDVRRHRRRRRVCDQREDRCEEVDLPCAPESKDRDDLLRLGQPRCRARRRQGLRRPQSGLCEHCAEAILGRRARAAEAVAA